MGDCGEIFDVLDILQERNAKGFCLTLKGRKQCIQVYSWESQDGPDEADFDLSTVLAGDFDVNAVTEAAETVLCSSIVVSFDCEGFDGSVPQPQRLMSLIDGTSGFHIKEFWANCISWRLLHRAIPASFTSTWSSLTSIELDLVMNGPADQECYRDIQISGWLRNFLDQLKMLTKLGLSFYSGSPEHDGSSFHAPLEHMLDTASNWPNLETLKLDRLDSTAEELLRFLESHSSTLRDLTLRDYHFLSGSWTKALPKIRELLSLRTAEVSGEIEACNELWFIESLEFDESCTLTRDLARWLTDRTLDSACPLTQENMVKDLTHKERIGSDLWKL